MSLYLYCVVHPRAALSLRGLRGTELTQVEGAGVAMVVGPSPEEKYRVCPDDMMAHYRPLETLMAGGPLLPVRYGSAANGPEEIVSRILQPRAEEFRRLLDWVRDKEEIGVKAYWTSMDDVYRTIRESNAELHKLAAGYRGYLSTIEAGRLVKESLEERRTALCGRIVDRLGGVSVESVKLDTYGDEMVAKAAFLIEKARAEAFEQEVGRLQEESGAVKMLLTRNCVPYNFINVVIDLE